MRRGERKLPRRSPRPRGRRRADSHCAASSYGSAGQPGWADRPRGDERAGRATSHGMHGGQAAQGAMSFHYVYLLQSEAAPDTFYVGSTDDLHSRLLKHNAGEVPHTSKSRPWILKTAVAFRDGGRASAFERYLESGSGHAPTQRTCGIPPVRVLWIAKRPREKRENPSVCLGRSSGWIV